MKAVYIDFVPESNIGVRNKITQQIASFNKKGVNVTHGFYDKGYYKIGGKNIIHESRGRILRKINEVRIVNHLTKLDLSDFNFIYIRYTKLTPWQYYLIRNLNKKNKNIIIEVPTYPYDKEYNFLSLIRLSDLYFRRKLNKYVSHIFYFGEYTRRIWGIPATQLVNAIDIDSINFNSEIKDKPNKNIINFVAVSKLAFWHGYDRFIMSLSKCKEEVKNKILFHVVGDGPEKEKLEQMTKELNLEKHVIFYGSKNGDALDAIYEKMQIGVSSLGLFRIGLDECTPLKPSEYAAKGLPFIIANHDPRFNNANFVFNIPNEDSIIDLEKTLCWYENLQHSRFEIRQFAKEHLTWDQEVDKIINFISK